MEFVCGVNQRCCTAIVTAFVREPVLYRHKAVRHPRLSPLVLVVVTATGKGLDAMALLFLWFFLSLVVSQQTQSESADVTQFEGTRKFSLRLQPTSLQRLASGIFFFFAVSQLKVS